jgi:flagellar M-ring protein FliF
MQRDVEYQPGRRIEHVVSHPGAIRRIHVVAVVREKLDATQRDQMLRLVAAAVGASPERGDTVVVQALQSVPISPPAEVTSAGGTALAGASPSPSSLPALVLLPIVALLVAASALAMRRRVLRAPTVSALSDVERRATLARVQQWLLQGEPVASADIAAVRGPQ